MENKTIAFDAVGTGNGIARLGESVVTLDPDAQRAFGRASHAIVTAEVEGRSDAGARQSLAVLARVAVPAKGKSATSGIDEILRWAIGVDNPEARRAQGADTPTQVRLRPATFTQRPWRVLTSLARRTLLVGKPQNHVYLRVKKSGLYTAERNVALVDALTMRLLGLESGGYAWLQAVSGGGETVHELRLKVIERPSALAELWARLEGADVSTSESDTSAEVPGGWGSDHPNPRRLFNREFDIPEIFVDAEVRSSLALTGQDLAVVRARASVAHLVMEEARSVLLVAVVAVAGISVSELKSGIVWLLLGVLVSISGLISAFRVRHKVSLN